jgi:hypothetical protein
LESLRYYDNLDLHYDKVNQDSGHVHNISEDNYSNENIQNNGDDADYIGNTYCEVHRSIIKYFCRNDLWKQGICNYCIHDHSHHDFVSANDIAAFEIKSDLKKSLAICKTKLNSK